MNCHEAQELLSALHDSELTESLSSAVAAHVESCHDCSEQLRVFREMSRLAATLTTPDAPDAWAALIAKQTASPSPRATLAWFQLPRLRSKWAAVAAILLVSGTIAVVFAVRMHQSHDLAETFGQFLGEFAKSPTQAESVLATAYGGERVTPTKAEHLLAYRPVVYQGLPPGYTLKSAYVMTMPCCTCFQANLASADGGRVAVFEHNGEQNEWFGERPSIEVMCQGKPTRLVQINSHLAASFRCGSRHLTIVGAKDMQELKQLVEFWPRDDGL